MEYCPHCMAPNVSGRICPICGASLDWTGQKGLELPIGTTLIGGGGLKTYWVGAALGQGGFGITYAAIETTSRQKVAIKEFFPSQLVYRTEDWTTVQATTEHRQPFQTGLDSFLREGKMLLAQGDLPSVVKVLDFIQANGTAYLVMEYLDGLPLYAYMKKIGGVFPPQELLEKLDPVIRDLSTLHKRGILHRDISPDNLMWMPNGTIKVMDFGSARSMEGGKSMTTLMKEGFSPLEQYRSKGQGPYSDIYALAATIYYCLTGVIPPGAVDRVVEDELRPPRDLGVNITVEQENAILWGLSVQASARPQSMEQFHNALYDTAAQVQTPPQAPSIPIPPTQPAPPSVSPPQSPSGQTPQESAQQQPVKAPPAYGLFQPTAPPPENLPHGPSSQGRSSQTPPPSGRYVQTPPQTPQQPISPLYQTIPLQAPATPSPAPAPAASKKLPIVPIAVAAVLVVIVIAVLASGVLGGGNNPSTLESRFPANTAPANTQTPIDTHSPTDPNGDNETNNPTDGTQSPIAPSDTNDLAGQYDLTIWVPDLAYDLTKSQIDMFNSSNSMGITINANVEDVTEADVAINMIIDASNGADLFVFSQDQLYRMVQAGAVSKLDQDAAAFVRDNNTVGSFIAAQAGSDYYAYPLSADNGYLMYYDRSVIPDEDVDSFEKLIEDCENAGKYFSYELGNAWYNAGVFFGTGCHSDWITDDEGNFISIDDDFNSDNGLIAAKAIYKLVSSPCYLNSSDGTGFQNGCAIIVTGTWNYTRILLDLGNNMGTADLPSFTVDGQEYHLGSYRGCQLLGVKPQTDAKLGVVANLLAQYLTGKECQLQRVEALGWGPSNIEALADPITLSNPAIEALNLQYMYSVMQPNIHGSWWDIADTLIKDIKDSDGSDSALRAALQKYSDGLQAVFTIPNDVKYAWTVIGSIGGSDWDYDFEMTKSGNIWTSNDIFDLNAGDEFKVRQGKNWDVSYGDGGNNFVVKTAGTYYIQFNEATGGVSLVPA